MRQLISKLSLHSLILWAAALTVLFLTGAFTTRQERPFVSDILFDLAFTILSSVLVAVLLAAFLDARERARWATFYTNNLKDLRDALHQLLLIVLHIPTLEVCARTSISFVSDPFDYFREAYRRDPAMLLAYAGSVKNQLDHLYINKKDIVDIVFFEKSQGFAEHLTTLDQLLQRTIASPHAPIEIVDGFRDLTVNSKLIKPFLFTNPVVPAGKQAEAITVLSLRIIESALIAYEATTRVLHDNDF